MKILQRLQLLTSRFEWLLIAFFALITLLMPLLYLQVNYFVVAVIVLTLSLIVVYRYRRAPLVTRLRKLIENHTILTIFTSALLSRLFFVLILSTQTIQVSDFFAVYEDSLLGIPTSDHTPIYAHFLTFPYILHFFVNIFGTSMLVGGIFNAVICSISIVLTYLVGSLVANKKVGVIAAILLMLWPGIAVYTSIYAPDHLTIALTLLSIFGFIKLIQTSKTHTKILYGLLSAVSLWSLGFFKDMAPIVMIAFVLITAVFVIKGGGIRKNLTTIGAVLGLCAVTLLASLARVPIISSIADRPTNPSLLSYLIYTGLADNDTGSWRPAIANRYKELIEQNDYNYENANDTMLHEALSKTKERASHLPQTIWNKNQTVQADDNAKIFWVGASAEAAGSQGLRGMLDTILQPINRVFFAGIVILMGAGVYFLLRDRRYLMLTLLITICTGYSLLLLVIEAQNRYRYIIEPLYIIIAAYGLYSLYNLKPLQKLLNKRKRQ